MESWQVSQGVARNRGSLVQLTLRLGALKNIMLSIMYVSLDLIDII